MSRIEYLVDKRDRRWARELLRLYSVDIQPGAQIGPGLVLQHGAMGLVVHPDVVIGSDVVIHQQVTIGRASFLPSAIEDGFEAVHIGDESVLCVGSKVLGGQGVLVVAPGTVVAANAVLLESTGPGEVWAGAPARCVGIRKDWQQGRRVADERRAGGPTARP